jgi:hypothetical protein
MKLPNILKSKKNGNQASANQTAVRTLVHRVARDPYVDWVIIFASSIVIAVALVILSICAYLNMDSNSASAITQNGSTATIDTKALMKVLGKFDDRATERAALLRGYNGPSDPSM